MSPGAAIKHAGKRKVPKKIEIFLGSFFGGFWVAAEELPLGPLFLPATMQILPGAAARLIWG
ncbi:hypothetical protein [Pseudaminobacter soli (ex Li et al. 2025)]|uniref:hypothetical protein n=1 Tax=Pseudaminobacter soli (ex Li et al. 2025) TaxID=1295366 RepID=UPI0011B29411|nr:hypothetical protein [Mesorhizobium soli]